MLSNTTRASPAGLGRVALKLGEGCHRLDLMAEVPSVVPRRATDLDAEAQSMQLVYSREWFMVAEKDGEPIAMAITVPDVNQVLKKMNGRLLPFGWWHFLRRHRTTDQLRVGFLGVKPEHITTGAGAALYEAHFDVGEHSPLKSGEAGWILEGNKAMNKSLQAMNGHVVKKWRMFERVF